MRYLIALLLAGCASQGQMHGSLTAAGLSPSAATAVNNGIAQEEVLDPSGLTAADTLEILKR